MFGYDWDASQLKEGNAVLQRLPCLSVAPSFLPCLRAHQPAAVRTANVTPFRCGREDFYHPTVGLFSATFSELCRRDAFTNHVQRSGSSNLPSIKGRAAVKPTGRFIRPHSNHSGIDPVKGDAADSLRRYRHPCVVPWRQTPPSFSNGCRGSTGRLSSLNCRRSSCPAAVLQSIGLADFSGSKPVP